MKTLSLQTGVIYGPINSRRLGRSLGINLSPVSAKVCSFDCVYCHYGPTDYCLRDITPFVDELPAVETVASALADALRVGPLPDYITFSGNGEPTLHRDFPEIVAAVKGVRDRLAPAVKIAILSNSTTCGEDAIRGALRFLDLRIMKLDAGSANTFAAVNGPAPGVTFDDVVSSLAEMSGYVVQTCFIGGAVSNADEEAVSSYAAVIRRLRPAAVQIYTTDRPVADEGVIKVKRVRLEAIAAAVARAGGVDVTVF